MRLPHGTRDEFAFLWDGRSVAARVAQLIRLRVEAKRPSESMA